MRVIKDARREPLDSDYGKNSSSDSEALKSIKILALESSLECGLEDALELLEDISAK